MDKVLFTVEEAGRLLSICRSSVYTEIQQKRLTAVKAGSKTLLHAAEIKRWADALPKLGDQ